MIPLDHQFNDLLNETIPFPLPQAAKKVVPKPVNVSRPKTQAESSSTTLKIAPTPSEASKPAAAMPNTPIAFTTCTIDCYHDVDLTPACSSGPCSFEQGGSFEQGEILEGAPAVEGAVEEKSHHRTIGEAPATKASKASSHFESLIMGPRSKVEISADQTVPFEIDTRMMINRPRLTLKESGLPIPLIPEEPDPSIVGESILGFKRVPKAATPSKALLEEKQQIQSQVSEEILDLLKQPPTISETPTLKAFAPAEPVVEPVAKPIATSTTEPIATPVAEPVVASVVDKKAIQETQETSGPQAGARQDDETVDECLYENSCEIADDADFEEYAIAQQQIAQQQYAEEQAEAATVEEAAAEKFYPLLQVDRYTWPDFCLDMHPIIKTQLGHLADQLATKSATARNVIAVVGSSPRAGSTTILLGLAKALEAAGQNIAIIDANINAPHLASSLGLQPEQGWETVLSGELPVEESLIDSLDDHIALLPLCLEESEKITFGVRPNENDCMDDAMQKIKKHYDLVLVDLGSPEATDIAAFSNMSEWIDSAVVVHNLRDGSRGQLIKMKNLMRDYGVSVAGVAENFAPREAYIEEPEYRAA